MDRGAWWATVLGVTKSWTPLKLLSMHAHDTLLHPSEWLKLRTDNRGNKEIIKYVVYISVECLCKWVDVSVIY